MSWVERAARRINRERSDESRDDMVARIIREEMPSFGGCGICGGAFVQIRPKHPGGPPRVVCPTCLQERTDRALSTLNPSSYEAREAKP